MKLPHILLVGILVISSNYTIAQDSTALYTIDQLPAGTEVLGNDVLRDGVIIGKIVTTEQLAALNAINDSLDAANTSDEKQQIITDAIAENPILASDPTISEDIRSIAFNSGLSSLAFDSAVIEGLSLAGATSAGNRDDNNGKAFQAHNDLAPPPSTPDSPS